MAAEVADFLLIEDSRQRLQRAVPSNAREAIEAHLEILAEEGKDLPKTRPLSEWQANEKYKGWTWGIVDVPVDRFFGPAEKINITVPGRLLEQIDDFAKTNLNEFPQFSHTRLIRIRPYERGHVLDQRSGPGPTGYCRTTALR
jgi:hypothetical protein